MRYYLFSFFIAIIGFGHFSSAKQFKNSYIAFEIPENWHCTLEATEWVCRSGETNESKEAIIVLTAKETGPQDKLEIYQNHVSNPIKTTNKSGGIVTSQVMSPPVLKQINNLTWVDGFHHSSEIQNYYTRYMATIKERIAVLVTFSAHKEFYSKYTSGFIAAINSLTVIATKDSLSDTSVRPKEGSLMPIKPNHGIEPFVDPLLEANNPTKKNNKFFIIIGAIIFAIIGIILLIRKKK